MAPIYSGNFLSIYSIMVGEFENEHSYIDRVKLFAVDHNSDVKVALSPTGEILTYQEPYAPISCVDNYGNDLLPLVEAIDNNYCMVYPDDYLILDLGDLDVSQTAKLVLRANLDFKKEIWMCIHVQVLNEAGEWADRAILRTRNNWSTIIVDLTEYLPNPDGTLKIRLYFTGMHKIDYVGLDTTPQADYELHYAILMSAIHSVEGNVRWKLLFSDNIYAELIPEQQIKFAFILPNNSEEARTFIIHVEGHYETVS